jgi:bifunctional DNA-binding transcriptional regulator/antitoxin component of YhaV-PrlF toxin-antitoxin module
MRNTKGTTETTLTSKNQVSLPVRCLRQLGWQRGDRLVVSVLGNDTLVLTRRPMSWADRFSGKMGHVWGDHEDTLRYLDQERASWSERFPDLEPDVR